MNFAEVHNDHLEIATETGVTGYILFLLSLIHVGSVSFRIRRGDLSDLDGTSQIRERFALARLFSLPLTICFGLLTLGQFPLQLAASSLSFLFLAAVCLSWSRQTVEVSA